MSQESEALLQRMREDADRLTAQMRQEGQREYYYGALGGAYLTTETEPFVARRFQSTPPVDYATLERAYLEAAQSQQPSYLVTSQPYHDALQALLQARPTVGDLRNLAARAWDPASDWEEEYVEPSGTTGT